MLGTQSSNKLLILEVSINSLLLQITLLSGLDKIIILKGDMKMMNICFIRLFLKVKNQSLNN